MMTPESFGSHPACCFARTVEDAARVDREDLLPRGVVGVEHRDAGEHTRVVDPDVEASDIRDDRLGAGAYGRGIRHVHPHAHDPRAESTRDVGCCGARERVVDVGDGDVGAGLSQPECDRLAQALGAPGDERSAAGERQQVAHRCFRDVGERVAHASTSAGIELCCAIWPSQARLGLGVRAKVSRSIAIRPNVGSQ